jgi:hypothetical protein
VAVSIVGQAWGRPRKAPPYTLPGELVGERAADSSGTGMERLAAQVRWGSSRRLPIGASMPTAAQSWVICV